MKRAWYLTTTAFLVSANAVAAPPVQCLKEGDKQLITVTDGNIVYAVNGTARGAAKARGWQDGAENYRPSELLELLDQGLKLCKGIAVTTTTTGKPQDPSDPSKASERSPLTPRGLAMAADRGDLAELKRYVEAKYDLNKRIPPSSNLGGEGSPPIVTAAYAGKCEAVDYLLANGAKADDKSVKIGQTAVMGAALSGKAQCMKSLLFKGARPDVRDEAGGDTPLITAAYHGNLEVVELLVQKGASLTATNKDGDTPCRAAKVMNEYYVAEYLKGKGGC